MFSMKMSVLIQKVQKMFVDDEERRLTIRQQKSVASFLLLWVIILQFIYITGLVEDAMPIYYILNWTVFLTIIVIFVLYCIGKLTLSVSFVVLQIFMQTEISLEMLLHAMDYVVESGDATPRFWIMVNMLLSLMFLMLSVCAYMYKLASVQASMALIAYIVCGLISKGPFLMNCLPLLFTLFTLMLLLGKLLHNNVYELQEENEMLKKEERAILKMLPFNKEELLAFTELVSCETGDQKAVKLLDNIGEIARNNIYAIAKERIKMESSQMETVQKVFPELSPSELAICRLILQDKTIGEICALLGKTSGNVTSQRVHIRTKLGLMKEDNLKKVLQERMKRYYEDEN